jgi:hypothetical protein
VQTVFSGQFQTQVPTGNVAWRIITDRYMILPGAEVPIGGLVVTSKPRNRLQMSLYAPSGVVQHVIPLAGHIS